MPGLGESSIFIIFSFDKSLFSPGDGGGIIPPIPDPGLGMRLLGPPGPPGNCGDGFGPPGTPKEGSE